jgi:hypothetical protein
MNNYDLECESIASSLDSENTQETNTSTRSCHICGKSSLFQFNKHCKFCSKTVCSAHSNKKRLKPGYETPQRICTSCEEKIIVKEIKEEIDKEVEKLGIDIVNIKVANENSKNECQEKNKIIELLKEEIIKREKILFNLETQLGDQLQVEVDIGESIRRSIEIQRRFLDEYIEDERILALECSKKENELLQILEVKEKIKGTNFELVGEIQQSYDMLKKSMLRADIEKSLCPKCLISL